MRGHERSSCRRTNRTVKHYMSCVVLVICNYFFLKSIGLSLISGICAEAATDYAAVNLENCVYFLQ